MAQNLPYATARFDRRFGWNEMREAHAGPNPFAVRGQLLEAVGLDDDDFRTEEAPATRRWTGDIDDDDDPEFGMALAVIAVVLIVVLLVGVTLVI